MVDNFCHSLTQKERRPGSYASLSPSEVVTLAIIFARWRRFASERDFYRYADASYLRDAFPTLPDRSQSNRLVRLGLELIEDTALHLATLLGARGCPYEAFLDRAPRCPLGTREAKGYWMADRTGRHRMVQQPGGWYEGDSACSCPAIPEE